MGKAAAKPDETINVLNGLIEVCRDGQKGFAEAAENIQNPQIRSFCLEQSRLRAEFIEGLKRETRRLGGDPENTGSLTGVIRRVWMDLKAALGSGDRAIIAVCEASEDSTISEYEKALAKPLPSDIYSIVEQQCQSIKQSHSRVKQIRDSLPG